MKPLIKSLHYITSGYRTRLKAFFKENEIYSRIITKLRHGGASKVKFQLIIVYSFLICLIFFEYITVANSKKVELTYDVTVTYYF